MEETRDIRIKRLRMRAWHRGIKEMDLILGGWADRFLADASDVDLDGFEAVLAEADHDLYQWVSGQAEAPVSLQPMLTRIAEAMQPTLGRGA